jgi:hypothetical protein
VCVCVCVYFLLFIKNYSRFGEGHEKESSIFLPFGRFHCLCPILPSFVGRQYVGWFTGIRGWGLSSLR